MSENQHRVRAAGWVHLGLAPSLALGLVLTGCGTSPGDDASGDGTGSVSPSVPGNESASASSSAGVSEPASEGAGTGVWEQQDLPEVPLTTRTYEGEPRPTGQVYQLDCLEALAGGEEVSATEGTGQDENGDLDPRPWSLQVATARTEGWVYCPTEMMGGLSVPASFGVEATGDGEAIESLQFTAPDGERIGGFRPEVPGGAPSQAAITEVLDVTEQPDYAGAGDETAYLRSLVVEAASGTQLLVDLVSVPEGADPASVDAWDLGVYGGTQRASVYGFIPLDSEADIAAARDSRLHEVLREMVSSYHPTVQ